ncbi:MAG TPA: hypothetical protein VFS52_10665 [Steroidobacteraceae bacterium]|jgi:cob(I)alamin adenosyltransferase|nr:hypothetical protein [Steroidobacteraceae bacterium]
MATKEKVEELNQAIQALARAISAQASKVSDQTVTNRLIRIQAQLLEAVANLGASSTPWSKVRGEDIDTAIELLSEARTEASSAVDLPSARRCGRAVGRALEALEALE